MMNVNIFDNFFFDANESLDGDKAVILFDSDVCAERPMSKKEVIEKVAYFSKLAAKSTDMPHRFHVNMVKYYTKAIAKFEVPDLYDLDF